MIEPVTTRPESEGDRGVLGVVDADVDGPVLTLTLDRKLLGNPDVLYVRAAVASEGQEGTGRARRLPRRR